MSHHLAQVNIARLLAPIDSEQLAGFVAGLDPINALADASEGFVWRLQTDDGDATAIRPFPDDEIMVNMSTWESVEHLAAFVRHPDHVAFLRRRRAWFSSLATPHLALWWVPTGHEPDPAEAKDRLAHLEQHGPSTEAFKLRRSFTAPA